MPKIIDFGVAKATSQTLTEKTMFTQLGQVVGTLEYMSPEIPVNDVFLVHVLDGLADRYEQFQAFLRIEMLFVAVLGHRQAVSPVP